MPRTGDILTDDVWLATYRISPRRIYVTLQDKTKRTVKRNDGNIAILMGSTRGSSKAVIIYQAWLNYV